MIRTILRGVDAQFRIAVAALVLFAGAAGLAQAQTVLVMNEDRILSESAVGIHIASQMEAIGAEIQAELSAQRQQISDENDRLTSETASLTQEAISQRPDLMQRIQALQTQAAQFEQLGRLRQQELVATQRQALQPVLQALQTILQEIVNERGASLLLDRSTVVYAADSLDITTTAIDRLNQRMTTTPVTRVRAPVAGQAQQ